MRDSALGSRRDLKLIAFLGSLAVGLSPSLDALQGRRLNGQLPAGGDVTSFSISADGKHALYIAKEVQSQGQLDLFSARLDARTPRVRLNPVSFGNVQFEVSSHERVVYGASSNFSVQLFSVPIDGGASISLNPPPFLNVRVETAAITPDGTRVVYLTDELYVVPIDGSGPAVKLNHPLATGWLVSKFTLNPAGTAVAYTTQIYSASVGSVAQVSVHVVPLDGSASPLQLAEHTNMMVSDPRFSPDGQWITYQLKPNPVPFLVQHPELHVVPIDGSRPSSELSDNVPNGKTFGCTFTSQGDRVVFLESFFNYGSQALFTNLYSSTLDGVGARIDAGTGFCACPSIRGYLLGLDGFTVYYSSSIGIFQVPADGSSAPLNLAAAGISTESLALAADGTRLVYTTRIPSTSVGLHSLSLSDGTVTDLHSVAGSSAVFSSVTIIPDSRYVLYRLSLAGSGGNHELYSVAIDGSSAPRSLNGVLPSSGGITSYQSVGGDVVYRGDVNTDEVFELFSVRLGPLGHSTQALAPSLEEAGG